MRILEPRKYVLLKYKKKFQKPLKHDIITNDLFKCQLLKPSQFRLRDIPVPVIKDNSGLLTNVIKVSF